MSSKELYTGCPVQHARQFLSGKWQIAILWNLKKQPLRFFELKKSLPEISEKVLTQELKFFEQKGFIEKKVFKSIPLRVEYALSSRASSLMPIIEKIIQWGYAQLQEEKANRLMTSTPVHIIEEIEASISAS